jgi:hypothetical protein
MKPERRSEASATARSAKANLGSLLASAESGCARPKEQSDTRPCSDTKACTPE